MKKLLALVAFVSLFAINANAQSITFDASGAKIDTGLAQKQTDAEKAVDAKVQKVNDAKASVETTKANAKASVEASKANAKAAKKSAKATAKATKDSAKNMKKNLKNSITIE